MAAGKSRISEAVEDSRQRLMLKCGWLAHKRAVEKGPALSERISRTQHAVHPDDMQRLRIPQPPPDRPGHHHRSESSLEGEGVRARSRPGVRIRQRLRRNRGRLSHPPRWDEMMSTSVGLVKAPKRPRERAPESLAPPAARGSRPAALEPNQPGPLASAGMYAMQWWEEETEEEEEEESWYGQEMSEIDDAVAPSVGKIKIVRPR